MSQIKITGNRIATQHDGFVVVIPDNLGTIMPLDCSVCKTLLRNANDVKSCEKAKCCHLCYLRWAESRKEAWKTGWRPSEEMIKEELYLRTLRPLSVRI